MMDRQYSNSTISTTASLRCSISSKNMLRNIKSPKKASCGNVAKYKTSAGSRWRTAARRDKSLTTLMKANRNRVARSFNNGMSLSSNLGKGFEGMRIGSFANYNSLCNANFKDLPVNDINCNDSSSGDSGKQQPLCIKSVELEQALHRDINYHMINDYEFFSSGKERWSAKSGSKKDASIGLSKPTRKRSGVKLQQNGSTGLIQPTRKRSDVQLC